MSESQLFAFPSIREFGGAVILEAMALGLVPIVVDYGGPGELVVDGVGFKLPLGNRAQIVSNLRDVLTKLCADPAPLLEMSRKAQARVQKLFTWDAKANQVTKVYDWVLKRCDKPSLFEAGEPLRRA
jgi:glycosyltransferase involved in cell wall biosynthesis